MKKYSFLFLAFVLLSFTACTSEVDDVFDQSSAQRIAESTSETKSLLESAPNGWIMDYYGNTDYGGYNVYLKFADNEVTAFSEMFGTESTTSHYAVKQTQGVLLSFDEYNEVFHFFSDPSLEKYGSDLASQYGDNGKAFEGDFEFRVQSTSADSIVLKGNKHGDRIVMRKAPADFSWDNYLDSVDNVESAMHSANYVVTNGSDTLLTVIPSRGHRYMEGTDQNGNGHDMSYIVKPDGIEFYEPVIVNGVTINGFKFTSDNVYPENNNSQVQLSKVIVPLSRQIAQGAWNVTYSNLSANFGQLYWNYSRNTQSQYGEEMAYAIFGNYEFSTSYGRNFGFTFASFDGSNTWWGTIGFDYNLVSDDEITLTYASSNVLNGDYYLSYFDYAYIVYPFAWGNTSRTFKLTCDNVGDPTWILMTDEANPNNTIRLTQLGSRPQTWPFRN